MHATVARTPSVSAFAIALLLAIVVPLQNAAAASSDASGGILHIPQYGGDFWKRGYLTGDWGGARTDLANNGVQFEVQFDQYVQGVTDGGRDRTTRYGGTADYLLYLDLMRMGVLPGALIRFRAESRYGHSVNGAAGPILPVNSDAFFPLTDHLDEDIPITVTNLNYVQFLSPHLGVVVGKVDTLDADLNEFASGRGTSQFMNANFLFNPAAVLRLPYSTLAAGVIWMPVPAGPDGGVTITSLVLNTADSSTTTGFDDFGDGATWTTEADFQYRLGDLPGGMNVGGLWSFDQNFAKLDTRIVLQPGEGLVVPTEHHTWAVYWSAWQYVFTEQPATGPTDLLNGVPDREGIGLFARVGFADEDTNPVGWAISGGIGGRGVIPSRDNDTFGIGYYYTDIETGRILSALRVEDSAQGFESYYNIALTPACHVTLDVQFVESAIEPPGYRHGPRHARQTRLLSRVMRGVRKRSGRIALFVAVAIGVATFAHAQSEGVGDQDVSDAYIYLLGRLLVLRQQQLDFKEGFVWNQLVHRKPGEVQWPNPNLDVAYSEAWVAVDETSCTVVSVPKVTGRYYTVQFLNGWGESLANINARVFPNRPNGDFAVCLKGAQVTIPAGAQRVDVPAKYLRVLARVELGANWDEAVALQQQFMLKATGRPKTPDIPKTPIFELDKLPGVEAFDAAESRSTARPTSIPA